MGCGPSASTGRPKAGQPRNISTGMGNPGGNVGPNAVKRIPIAHNAATLLPDSLRALIYARRVCAVSAFRNQGGSTRTSDNRYGRYKTPCTRQLEPGQIALCSRCRGEGRKLCAEVSKSNHQIPAKDPVEYSKIVITNRKQDQNIQDLFCSSGCVVSSMCPMHARPLSGNVLEPILAKSWQATDYATNGEQCYSSDAELCQRGNSTGDGTLRSCKTLARTRAEKPLSCI